VRTTHTCSAEWRTSPTPNFTKIGQEVWHVRADFHWGHSVRPVGTKSVLLDMCLCASGVPCVLRYGRTWQKHGSYAGAGSCSGCSHVGRQCSSAAVPVLWIYVRVISILSALSTSVFSLSCSGILHYYALRSAVEG
jgi:hypothetical protein